MVLELAPFLLLATAVIVMPGPNVMVVVATSLGHGPRRGLQTVIGTSTAMILQLLIAGVGTGLLVEALAQGLYWLKWLGVCYLLYLGFRHLFAANSNNIEPLSAYGSFQRGFWISLTNPKTILFFGAFLPQFVSPDGSYMAQITLLSILFWLLAVVFDSLYALVASRLASAWQGNYRHWVLDTEQRPDLSRRWRRPRLFEQSIVRQVWQPSAMSPIHFEFLADRPADVPLVMNWWHSFWGDRMGNLEAYTEQFLAKLGKQDLPLDIVAIKDNQPVGTAALKEHEMEEIYPDYQYWMGSVFVAPEFRGQGIARLLAEQIIRLARQHQLPQLYLQTVDLTGGLYSRLGWEPLDRLEYYGEQTLVMVKYLE